MCGECNREKVEFRLSRIPMPAECCGSKSFGIRFVELLCGHAFDVQAFDLYMEQYNSSTITGLISTDV